MSKEKKEKLEGQKSIKKIADTAVEVEKISTKTKNPYTPYDDEPGKWYYHRKLIDKIRIELVNQNRIMLLRGNSGSGKTSTLRKIGLSDKLGKDFFPVYINAKKLLKEKSENLLESLLEKVTERFKEYGIAIRLGKTILENLLILDSILLKENKTLVLILDEFDDFLISADQERISAYIELLENIDKDWSDYGLILASDLPLAELISSTKIQRFLDFALKIVVEDAVDKASFERIILEPVEGKLKFEKDALNYIVSLCGKNLYFQKLVCSYIFDFLTESDKKKCTKKHVEEVLETKILKDEQPTFAFAWNDKISVEDRLIAAALADENIIQKRGKYNYLPGKFLLDEIFGDKFDSEIKRLNSLGYINKMEGRRFRECPFVIPLYGKWIERYHPFWKTVFEHMDYISECVEFDDFVKAISGMQTKDFSQLGLDQDIILRTAKQWTQLKYKIVKQEIKLDKVQVKDFLLALGNMVSLAIQEPADTNYFSLNIKDLNIGILRDALCLFQERSELTGEDISNIANIASSIAEDTQVSLTIIFHFSESGTVENLVKNTYLNVISISEKELLKILIANRPRKAFRATILKELSLQKISPYQIAGPAKATFYGRSKIINRVTGSSDTSYAIPGARRIGKTSLLQRLYENQPPNSIYLYINLELISQKDQYKGFLYCLELAAKSQLKRRVRFVNLPFFERLKQLPKVITQLVNGNTKFVLLIDEVDALLKYDEKYKFKLMKIFRDMAQRRLCQFIFAGFKELYHTKRNISNPLYNFCEEIPLKPFKKEEAFELMTQPMESIGIHYKNLVDRERIFIYTAGHPNLIQFFCKHLVEKAESHDNVEERRIIFRTDIEQLFNSEYEKYIIDDVYLFLSDLSEINRFILILLVENRYGREEKEYFSIHDIKNIVEKGGIEVTGTEVGQQVQNLVMRFILIEETVDRFRFALSVFPNILEKNIDGHYKDQLREDINKARKKR